MHLSLTGLPLELSIRGELHLIMNYSHAETIQNYPNRLKIVED
jgi:hypothetical protein